MRNRVAVLVFAAVVAATSPAFAQVDLSGYWANRAFEDNQARGPGLLVGEYTGFPLNAAGRMKAWSWDAAIIANRERQCIPLGIMTANTSLRISRDLDTASQQEIAWRIHLDFGGQERVIWMDGRPHPPANAAHTWQGFSTGRWEGNQLVVTTTHLKMHMVERNGIPRSDRATTVEHFLRRGDILTVIHTTYDPIWLEAPFIQTRDFVLDTLGRSPATNCIGVNEIATRAPGAVPHYLPGKNPLLESTVATFNVSAEAMKGGAPTMYPEFESKAKGPTPYVEPDPATLPAKELPPVVAPDPATVEVSVLPVRGNVYMLVGSGANTTVQIGDHSVVVVDTQVPAMTDKIVAEIRKLTTKPIRYVINTNGRPDHRGGNEGIAKAGQPFQAAAGGGTPVAGRPNIPAPILAHENVLLRLSAPTGEVGEAPFAAWPSDTYIGNDYRFMNAESVRLLHMPAATNDGDSLVWFQESNVIVAGDIFNTTIYPIIDREQGGSIDGVIGALNRIIDMCAMGSWQQDGATYVIPGHGRISDQADVVEYRDMLVIIRDRIQGMAKRGLTLDQVKAEHPTFDYDGLYGAPTATWNKDRFIEAIYQDVGGKSPRQSTK